MLITGSRRGGHSHEQPLRIIGGTLSRKAGPARVGSHRCCRSHGGPTAVNGDAGGLAPRDGSFQLIKGNSVLAHGFGQLQVRRLSAEAVSGRQVSQLPTHMTRPSPAVRLCKQAD